MNLMKIQRDGMNCQFPNWVLKQWKIIPRGGMRAMPQNSAPRPRQVTFPDLHSFILASQLVHNCLILSKIVIFYTEILTRKVVSGSFFKSETSEKSHNSTFRVKISV